MFPRPRENGLRLWRFFAGNILAGTCVIAGMVSQIFVHLVARDIDRVGVVAVMAHRTFVLFGRDRIIFQSEGGGEQKRGRGQESDRGKLGCTEKGDFHRFDNRGRTTAAV